MKTCTSAKSSLTFARKNRDQIKNTITLSHNSRKMNRRSIPETDDELNQHQKLGLMPIYNLATILFFAACIRDDPLHSIARLIWFVTQIDKQIKFQDDYYYSLNLTNLLEKLHEACILHCMSMGIAVVHELQDGDSTVDRDQEFSINAFKLLNKMLANDFPTSRSLLMSRLLVDGFLDPCLEAAYTNNDLAHELVAVLEHYLHTDKAFRCHGNWHQFSTPYDIRRVLVVLLELSKHWFDDREITTRTLETLMNIYYGDYKSVYEKLMKDYHFYCWEVLRGEHGHHGFRYYALHQDVVEYLGRIQDEHAKSGVTDQTVVSRKVLSVFLYKWGQDKLHRDMMLGERVIDGYLACGSSPTFEELGLFEDTPSTSGQKRNVEFVSKANGSEIIANLIAPWMIEFDKLERGTNKKIKIEEE